tara:strand:- start:418 stop:612 length:195 start_codon:yes stop_codon:yes gene_type:complete
MNKGYQYNEVIAFAEGYYEGRATGVSNNMYDDDILRIQYDAGYDRGVSDYSDFDAEEEDVSYDH